MRRKHDTRRIPPDAQHRVHQGKPQVQLRVGGKLVWCDVTTSGRASVIRPEWYGQLRMADGTTQTIKLFADKLASEAQLREQQRLQDRIRVGLEAPLVTTEQKFSDLLERYLSERARKGVDRERYSQKLKKMLTGLKVDSIQKIRELTTERITKFTESMTQASGQPAAPNTKIQHLVNIGTFLRWLKTNHYIGTIPRMPSYKAIPKTIRRAITSDEVSRLVAASPWPRSLFYELLFVTMARRGAMCAVLAEDFHLDSDSPWLMLRGTESKTKRDQQVPIPPRLVELIQKRIDETPSGVPLFGHFTSNIINWHFINDCKSAGINRVNHEGTLVIHSLRHGGATELLKAGVSILLVQRMGGWKNLKMLENHYAHLSPVQDRAGIDLVFNKPKEIKDQERTLRKK